MIRVLPRHVADQIAAGEVIERPASVVKELVENALDAGAQAIRVDLEDGGKRSIRVTDDGSGIDAADLPLAFLPHATSKIETAEDLFRVSSFGFRGEALASIGAIARAEILTRKRGATLGLKITCDGGVLSPVIDAGAPEGTTVHVMDLFQSIPVRRQFLKSSSAEVTAVAEMIVRLALPHPDVDFTLHHEGREVIRAPATERFENRIVDLFGKDVDGGLCPVRSEKGDLSVDGFLGMPKFAKGRASHQYVFLNGRFIRDKSIQQAIVRAYEGFLLPRKYPVYFLRIAMDPAAVDVNVHPTKIEVRFRDKNAVFGAVFAAARRALEAAHGGRMILPSHGRQIAATGPIEDTAALPGFSVAETIAARASAPVADQSAAEERSAAVPSRSSPCVDPPSKWPAQLRAMEKTLYPDGPPLPTVPAAPNRGTRDARPSPPRSRGRCAVPAVAGVVRPGVPERFIQMHDSWILVEESFGFSIVDQHALHERCLFEGLMAKDVTPARQPLLIPAVLDLSPGEREKVRAAAADLESLGLVVTDFGRLSLAIQEVPLDLSNTSPERLIDAVLAADEERTATGFHDLRRNIAAGMACRAAVKFNDRLDDRSIRELLQWARAHPHAAACPHGRPIRIEWTLDELEQRFLRKA